MNIEKIDAPSTNITLPLNQSVQQANGAQFALMLSLMMESLPASSSSAVRPVSMPAAVAPHTVTQPDKNFNLEVSQTRALQNHQMHHFQLLHSLYEERVMPVDVALQQANANSGLADEVLQEIERSHAPNPMAGREAEKVSFAA